MYLLKYNKETTTILALGALLAVLICTPFYNWVFGKSWNWAEGFPLGWLGAGLTYMSTFFHELGHTVFAWFYGYPTLPMFDFNHGGGLAIWFSDQQIFILAILYLAVIYGVFHFKEHRGIQVALVCLILFNLLTAFNEDVRFIVIDFMGPAAEPLVACFLLVRALFDLAPRGWFERLLNAVIGFAMIFRVFIDSYGLLNSGAYRLVYYQQKGSHGFGDFDKINDRISFMNFQDVVYVWAALALICLIIPFILYGRSSAHP